MHEKNNHSFKENKVPEIFETSYVLTYQIISTQSQMSTFEQDAISLSSSDAVVLIATP